MNKQKCYTSPKYGKDEALNHVFEFITLQMPFVVLTVYVSADLIYKTQFNSVFWYATSVTMSPL